MVFENYYEQYRFSDYFKTNLPLHWNEKRLGFLAIEEKAAFVDGPFGSDLKSSDYIDEGIPLIQLNNIRNSKHLMQNMKFVSEEKKQQLIRHIAIPGDVVIAKMADPVARAAIVNEEYSEYVIVADCVKFTPNLKLINLRYLVWAINCDYVRVNAELVSTGTTRVRINLGELKKLKIPYPPTAEQIKIANFLDHETVKIDTLIAKQEELIKLLNEKRQAVISHAVTKGINPNAPMHDSGVEWLGEVPAHWVVSNMDYALSAIGDVDHYMPKSAEKGIPYVMTGDLKELASNINFENCKQVSHSDYLTLSKKIKSSRGDVIMARYATVGTVSYIDVDADFLVSYSCVTIKPNLLKVVGLYLFYYFKSDAFLQGIQSQINTNTQGNVGVNDLKKIKVALPTLTEQSDIIEYLQSRISKFDSMSDRSVAAITLAQERRKALISAAVTGKIDVRDWQPTTVPEVEDAVA